METLQAFSGLQGSMYKTQTDSRTEAIIGGVGGGTSGLPGEVFVCVMFHLLFQKKAPPVRLTESSSHSLTFLSLLFPVENHCSRPNSQRLL